MSSSNISLTPVGLNNGEQIGSDFITKPSDNSLHKLYTFYVKVTALGGSSAFFGPFKFDVGCTDTSVTVVDSPSLSLTGE